MQLRETLVQQGNWLFKWRSYVPLIILAAVFLAMGSFHYPFGSHRLDTVWDFVSFSVALLGLLVRILTVGFVPARTSGRNTKEQVADTLNTTGMYSLTRNPLYLGNFLIWLGASLVLRVWWFTALVALIFFVLYERIMLAEESFLLSKFGDVYAQWAAKTPVFLPKLGLWQRPARPFSFKAVLRRENSTLLGIIVVFSALETLGTLHVEHRFVVDRAWGAVLVFGICLYVFLKILKKRKLLGSG